VPEPALSISLRPATAEDEAFLNQMYFDWRREGFALLPFSEQQLRDLIQMQYRAQIASYSAQFPASGYEMILANGERAGRIWIARQAGQIHIVDLLIDARQRNRGIGAVLIQRLQEEARQAGLPILARVDRANPGSLRFHQRCGFRIVGEELFDLFLEWISPAESDHSRSQRSM
jgi:GNAT superfamily N-acetyltransferase